MNRRTGWILLAVLGAAVVLAVGWWTTRPPQAAVLTVQPAPLRQVLQFSARVATVSRVDLGATLTGRVAAVAVREGDAVRAGQPLLRLEDAELKAALAQAQAAEQQASAALAGLRSSGRDSALAGVTQAEADLQAARNEQQRTAQLVVQGFLSMARQDEAQRALAVAQARLASAKAQQRAIAELGSDLAQAQAAQALARAAAAAAGARLAQSVLTAPADGRVLSRQVEPGQIVQPGRALLTLALAGPLELLAAVDERYLQQLQTGQAAQALADAFPGRPFAAVLRSIAPLVDAQRGAVDLKFSVDQPPAFLREDMTLSLAVTTGSREAALTVPLAALRDGPSGPSVWLQVDGRVLARPVRLGLQTLEAAEVLQGLAAGDVVLVGQAPAPGEPVRGEPWRPGDRAAGGGSSADNAGSAFSEAMGR